VQRHQSSFWKKKKGKPLWRGWAKGPLVGPESGKLCTREGRGLWGNPVLKNVSKKGKTREPGKKRGS